VTIVDPLAPLGRNEECWCGSGAKYKRCHGDHRPGSQPADTDPYNKMSVEKHRRDELTTVATDVAAMAPALSLNEQRRSIATNGDPIALVVITQSI
jgi:SEC-C motif